MIINAMKKLDDILSEVLVLPDEEKRLVAQAINTWLSKGEDKVRVPTLYGSGDATDLPSLAGKLITDKVITVEDDRWSIAMSGADLDYAFAASDDFEELLTENFVALMELKTFTEGLFSLEIPVTSGGIDDFDLPSHVVAMLSALGCQIEILVQKTE